jgi:hypothetical protein
MPSNGDHGVVIYWEWEEDGCIGQRNAMMAVRMLLGLGCDPLTTPEPPALWLYWNGETPSPSQFGTSTSFETVKRLLSMLAELDVPHSVITIKDSW